MPIGELRRYSRSSPTHRWRPSPPREAPPATRSLCGKLGFCGGTARFSGLRRRFFGLRPFLPGEAQNHFARVSSVLIGETRESIGFTGRSTRKLRFSWEEHPPQLFFLVPTFHMGWFVGWIWAVGRVLVRFVYVLVRFGAFRGMAPNQKKASQGAS